MDLNISNHYSYSTLFIVGVIVLMVTFIHDVKIEHGQYNRAMILITAFIIATVFVIRENAGLSLLFSSLAILAVLQLY